MFQSTSFSPVDLIFEAAGDRLPGQQLAEPIAVMPGDFAAGLEKHASTPRLRRKIEEALGVAICQALHDRDVTEIMLNPDGKLFVERSGKGLSTFGQMSRASAEVTIGVVAHALGVEIDAHRPIVSGQLPIGGHRFEGLLPPIVAAPTFSIRRRSRHQVLLESYVHAGAITLQQAAHIRSAIDQRLNIIVSGGTGSGKTTLASAILAEIVDRSPADRLVLLEDTPEIECAAANLVPLQTSDIVDMRQLLKSTLRLRPDRIIVGEVRDGAALTLLKAWNTGHPGGVATVHSNSARSALSRLEQLTSEATQQPVQSVIGEAVDLIISLEKTPRGRRVKDLLRVSHFDGSHYHLDPLEEACNAV